MDVSSSSRFVRFCVEPAALLLAAALGATACGGGDGASGSKTDAGAAPPSTDAAPRSDAGLVASGDAAGAPGAAGAADATIVAPPSDAGGAPTTRWTCDSMRSEFEKNTSRRGRVCVEVVADRATWESISAPERPGSDIVRATKFFLPITAAAGIPPSFLDADTWGVFNADPASSFLSQPWHLLFAAMFLPRVGNPLGAYQPPTWVAYGGYIAEFEVTGVGRVFGYFIEFDNYPCETHKRVHADLAKAFTLKPLYRATFGPHPSPNKTIAGCDVPALVVR